MAPAAHAESLPSTPERPRSTARGDCSHRLHRVIPKHITPETATRRRPRLHYHSKPAITGQEFGWALVVWWEGVAVLPATASASVLAAAHLPFLCQKSRIFVTKISSWWALKRWIAEVDHWMLQSTHTRRGFYLFILQEIIISSAGSYNINVWYVYNWARSRVNYRLLLSSYQVSEQWSESGASSVRLIEFGVQGESLQQLGTV